MFVRYVIVAAFLLGTWAMAGQATHTIAYVVFGSQIVAVDTSEHRVIKRMDVGQQMRPAITASLVDNGKAIIVAGSVYSDEKNSGFLKIDLSNLSVVATRGMQRGKTLPFFQCNEEQNVVSDKVVVVTSHDDDDSKEVGPEYIETIDAGSLKTIARAAIEPDKDNSPYQRCEHFALTPDGKQLLAVTSSGFKWQCFLRIYSFPDLNLEAALPLLEICDDTPIAIVVPRCDKAAR